MDNHNVTYNAKKSMCMVFNRYRDLCDEFNDRIPVTLNGSRMMWVNCVKHLGNYIRFDLSECEEIRHKKADFVWRVNGLLMTYRDAHPKVKMYLLSSHCCHLYGSQAWALKDRNIEFIATAWNRGVRRIWSLPFQAHRKLLCGLNDGCHIWDCVYKRICGAYETMVTSQNEKLVFLMKIC